MLTDEELVKLESKSKVEAQAFKELRELELSARDLDWASTLNLVITTRHGEKRDIGHHHVGLHMEVRAFVKSLLLKYITIQKEKIESLHQDN